MEFGMEKCTKRKQHMTEGVELPNQEKARMLGEKETYKYSGILEANTIKQGEMKERIKKSKLLETKLIKIPGLSPPKTLGTFLEVDQRRTLTNGPENKKTNDHA